MAIRNDYSDLTLPKPESDSSIFTYIKIVLVPVLIYAAALLGYFNVIKFHIEIHSLIMMGIILIIALFFARHNADFAFSVLSKKSADFKSSLKDFIVSNLLEISGVKKSNVCFDNFLSNYIKGLRNSHIAGMGYSIFPMLGILGTFISIAISMPSFSSSDSLGLEKEIGILLNGVGTAFYVSIYGIFLAIWWMFFEKFGVTKFDNFSREQKELSKEFFWQKDELEQRFMSVASEHFDDIRSVFSRISNEDFFKNLDNVVGNKFKSYSELQNLEQRMISESQIKFDQNIRLLNKAGSRQDEFVKIHTEILKATIDLNLSLKDMQKSFSTEYNRLNELMQDKVNGFEKSVNKFDLNLKTLDLSLKEFATKIISEQNNAMQAFKVGLLEGISAFKEVYEQEKTLTKSELEREIALQDLKKNANELDGEVQRVMQNIESSNLEDEISK
ncbi:MotA/TolQ/ExbB proton channel family protein [Campylobacter pinnipediorum]|uniref:MotA/TolQ/ExbB proton channel family protein n=1 Tax=Campylobacter pinnipediorum TaxID=1965231 RepID=UPI00084DEFCA|nr:MotA/TolQ/ExbB proton channel family protein [Campylobacter pinnipediorum]AQW81497.1 putative membrane protein [Campylobacter pinnipediorum subsp. pinnipediorum]AQW83125.1 putative membrane protein [Campylobacter pinnipediorum subsp. pinnipediorum]